MSLVEINTDGLAKLGETIFHGLGITAYGNKKLADAEQYAAIKKVETETKVELLKLKGQSEIAEYVLSRETRKFNNAKAVIEYAANNFSEGEQVSSEPVSQSWLNRFFDIVENISEEDVQEIWGKILAGEVKQPKSYSLRTLEVLQHLTQEDAKLFIQSLNCYIANGFICVEDFVLSLNERLRLLDCGLIYGEDLVKEWMVNPHGELLVKIDDDFYFELINATDKMVRCHCNVRKITTSGLELMRLFSRIERNGFYASLAGLLKYQGISRVIKYKATPDRQSYDFTNGEEL